MKKEKVVYKVDNFVDFRGETRQFIFAAVSVNTVETITITDDDDIEQMQKVVRLGVSVQKSGDILDTELGKKIAYGKAMKDKSCVGKLYATDKGMINSRLVEALLEQEAEYFKNRPGKYLAGYDKDMEKWLAEEE